VEGRRRENGRKGRPVGLKIINVGPTGGSWYRVGDIGDDGCGEMATVLQNLADWTEYSLLGDEFGV
jgi:hypothetical protein